MSRFLPIALATALLAATGAQAQSQGQHKLFNLDPATSIFSYATDFCGKGLVAGTTLTSDWYYAGYVSNQKGEVTTYTVPGATYTEVMGCHQSQLMGQAIVNGVRSGFYQDAAGVAHLVAPEGSAYPTVEGMNSAGTVVGWYMPADKDNVRASAFIIQDGVFTRYDLKGRPDTRLIGVLEDGTLYGTYLDGIPLRATGFIIRNGKRTELHIEGSYDTTVTGMNASGQVVGYYSNAIGSPYRGFVWENGVYTKFSFAAEGGNTYPKGIDAQGKVVGYISNPDYSSASFIARPAPATAR